MRKVGIYSTSGDKHTRLRNQMRRLFGCTVSLLYEDARGEATLNAPIARLTEFWWSERQPDARSLWESKIELGEDFFNEIIRCPIPIDLNTLRAMKRSPLGLDLYLWLTYRTFALKRPLRLTWRQLYRQFGVDPARANDKATLSNFRADCLRELKKIKTRGRTCTIGRSLWRYCSRRRRRVSRRRNYASWNSPQCSGSSSSSSVATEHTLGDGKMETPNEPHGIIPNHHFAKASSECIGLYRDGYLLSAVMLSQSVAEGIWRFVLERNQIQPDGDLPTVAPALVEQKIISTECADAFVRIWGSFRNDVHHMSWKISTVKFPEVAKRNMDDLATIERELFAVTFGAEAGKIVLVQPRYWDLQEDGMTQVFLREPRIGPGVGVNASREDAT